MSPQPKRRHRTGKETRTTKARRPIGRYAAMVVLIALGTAMIVFGAWLWLGTSRPPSSSVDRTSTTTVQKPTSPSDTTPAVTTVRATDTTHPAEPTHQSESLTALLLGLGTLLVLCGIFFSRIAKVTLPGGAGFELAPADQAKVVAKTAATAKERGIEDPDAIARIYQDAMATVLISMLLERGAPAGAPPVEPAAMSALRAPDYPPGYGTSPGDDLIDNAVTAAADRFAAPAGDGDDHDIPTGRATTR